MIEQSLDIQTVKEHINALKDNLLVFLNDLVRTNSFSLNREGVEAVRDIFSSELPDGFEEVCLRGCEKAGFFTWGNQRNEEGKPVLLSGHLDTVFPPGAFEKGVTARGPYLCGPGIADMKGGLAVMIGAVRVLHNMGVLPRIPLILGLNGDEEIGSQDSVPATKELAGICRLGLGFESAGADGGLVTSRRGVRRYRLEILGEWGHAGFITGDKQSAIVELAHQVLRLEKLNNYKAGVSLNIGKVKGGVAASVNPPEASMDFEVRFWDKKNGDAIEERILASLASPKLTGVRFNLVRIHYRPAYIINDDGRSFYEDACRVAERLGFVLSEEARKGASDANLLNGAGLPVLDGFGPIGEADHSLDERILESSLYERIELVTHLLWELAGR